MLPEPKIKDNCPTCGRTVPLPDDPCPETQFLCTSCGTFSLPSELIADDEDYLYRL